MKDKRKTMTSIEANDQNEVEGKTEGLQRKAFFLVWNAGEEGMTQPEASMTTGIPRETIGPRFNELRGMGLLKVKRNSANEIVRRENPETGRSTQVWVSTGRSWDDRLPLQRERENKDLIIRNLTAEIERLKTVLAEARKEIDALKAALHHPELPGIS